MTAGHAQSVNINRHLIHACAINNWAMGVGSQRRELTDDDAAQEWRHLRGDFPNVDLYSNLGIAQLINTPLSQIKKLAENLSQRPLLYIAILCRNAFNRKAHQNLKDVGLHLNNSLIRLNCL